MSIKKKLLKNTLINLFGYFYLLAASFFSVSFMLRQLGKELFGSYLFLISIVSLSTVFEMGVSISVIRKLSLPDISAKSKIKTIRNSLSIYLFLALVLAVITPIFIYIFRNTPVLSNLSSLLLIKIGAILFITVFVNFLNNHFLNLAQANQNFAVFNSKTFLVGTANTALAALVTYFSSDISHIFLMQLVFHLATFFYISSYVKNKFGEESNKLSLDFEEIKDLVVFGVKNFVGTLASQIESQLPNYTLGAGISASAITFYSIPQSIVVKGAGIVSQVAQAFFPFSASLLEKSRIKKLAQTIILLQFLTLLLGVFSVFCAFQFGNQFLTLWLKDPVVVFRATPILKTLSFYFLLVSLTPIPTSLLQSLGKPQIPSFFAVLTTLVEAGLMFYFVPKFGPDGVAKSALISTAISVPLFLIVTLIVFSKEVKKILYEK